MSTEHSDIGSEDDLAELHQQVHETRSGVVKYLLIAIGSISVFLGILGIILPIVPTTPFLLLAAICYSHSSERFYIWLLTNRFFGSYIRDWRENKGLTIATKIWIIFVLVTTMGISAIFFVPLLPVKIGLAVIGTIITLYILSLPTKRPENSSD
jgi:hypothetical protein